MNNLFCKVLAFHEFKELNFKIWIVNINFIINMVVYFVSLAGNQSKTVASNVCFSLGFGAFH